MAEKNYKRTTVTAALPYANGGVHIGHLAGVYIPADIYVRYLRLKGEEVAFICGSDEHGVPITIRAKKEGITPQDVVDRYHQLIKDSFSDFGISFDIYSRTTSETHKQTASDFFKHLLDNNKLQEGETEQLYDEEAHQFLADRYITGECPHCHNLGAMATNAKAADVTFHPQSSSIQRVLSAVQLLFYAKLRTGIYLLTTIKHGLKSGFWKDIRNGEPMFMVNVKAG